MINSKAINILKKFTEAEIDQLKMYLVSPFLNTNKRAAALYLILCEYYPAFNENDITYKNLFDRIYTNSKYNEALIRNLLSDLMESILQFLAIKRFRLNRPDIYTYAGEELLEREWHTEFTLTSGKLYTSIEKMKHKDETYSLYKMKYESQMYNYNSRTKLFDKYLESSSAESVENELDKFYIFSKANIMISEALIYLQVDINHEENKINGLLSLLNSIYQNKTTGLYISFLMFYKTRTEKDYFILRSKFYGKEDLLNFDTSRNIFVIMRMYTFEKSISSKEFAEENRKILNEMAEKGFLRLFEKGYIAEIDFRNYVIVNCQAGNYDLAEEFVESNRLNLPPKIRSGNYLYSKAHISFYRKQFKSSLRDLAKISYSDHHLKLSIDSLTLRCLYELGLSEEMYSRLSSLSNYLHRNRSVFSGEKELFQNFISHIRKLQEIKNSSYKIRSDFAEIVQNSKTVCKSWLLEKVLKNN